MSNDGMTDTMGRMHSDAINLGEYDEIMEWWLITPFMAHLLNEYGEITISEYGCHWWGRQTSGQAIYMDAVIRKIAEEVY